MKTQEEFLEAEIEEFEAPEYQTEFNQLSDERKNDILFKRLLFDYDEDLMLSLKKFIQTDGNEPSWPDLLALAPELKYITAEPSAPMDIAKIVVKEIKLGEFF